eukprot:351773-Chlamydomonas_euryale.AAC.15
MSQRSRMTSPFCSFSDEEVFAACFHLDVLQHLCICCLRACVQGLELRARNKFTGQLDIDMTFRGSVQAPVVRLWRAKRRCQGCSVCAWGGAMAEAKDCSVSGVSDPAFFACIHPPGAMRNVCASCSSYRLLMPTSLLFYVVLALRAGDWPRVDVTLHSLSGSTGERLCGKAGGHNRMLA